MNPIIVRKATLADMDTLLAFEQGVIAAERPFDSSIKKDPVHYYNLQEMITSPHIELLVAEHAGQLVGSGYARIETARHFYRHSRQAYLGFMYTIPVFRGKGINQQIISALENWANQQQVYDFLLEVYVHNAPAIKSYEKAGFTCTMLEMRKSAAR